MYNLHVYGGVKPQSLVIELVVYGAPLPVPLNNEAYRKRFGVNNPNIEIIEAMKKAGINIYACGQSVLAWEVKLEDLHSYVQVVFSRLTTVSTRQLRGYAFFKF